METGTSRTKLDPDGEESFVSLRRALGVTSFGMNQLVLAPRQRGRIHRHQRQEEVYLVLEGTLALGGDGEHTGRDGRAFTSWDDVQGASPQEIPLPEDLPA